MKIIRSIRNLFQHPTRGQGLVETAIVAPILIFMMIGVFEVGWALRGYLVLANVNREATRFGVRPGYMRYDNWPPPPGLTPDEVEKWKGEHLGYDKVVAHMFTSLSNQLNTTDVLSPGVVISHFVIKTKLPCAPVNGSFLENKDCDGDGLNWKQPAQESPTEDCDGFVKNGYDGWPMDNDVVGPDDPGFEYYAYTYDPDPTDAISYTTAFSYPVLKKELEAENNEFNCLLLKRTPTASWSHNYVLVVEMWYKQPQLFGFPLLANPFTDPVPMYAHTTMRMIPSRGGNDEDKTGPRCFAIPFTIRDTFLTGATEDVTVFDIMGGANPELGLGDERGFLAWDPQWQNVSDLDNEFSYPETSFNSYANVHDPTDTRLTVGDYVKSLPGNNNASTINDQLNNLIFTQQDVIVPVWDTYDASTSSYHIKTFIRVRLVSNPAYHLTTNNPEVWALYRGEASECLY